MRKLNLGFAFLVEVAITITVSRELYLLLQTGRLFTVVANNIEGNERIY
jgi:hypothetical protein